MDLVRALVGDASIDASRTCPPPPQAWKPCVESNPSARSPTDGDSSQLGCARRSLNVCRGLPGPTGPAHAVIEFHPCGYVTRVVVEGPLGSTPRGACIAKVFWNTRISPFIGGPVRVGQSFDVE